MKTIPADLATHLAQEVTTLAYCWKLTRPDGVVLAFTSHDQDIEFSEVVYKANYGFTSTAIPTKNDLAVDQLETESWFTDGGITQVDIEAGKFDNSRVEIFMVNWSDPGMGRVLLRSGILGEVSYTGGRYKAELRGMMQLLQQKTGRLYLPVCDAALGDANCTVNLNDYTVTGTVTGVTSRRTFADSSRTEEDGWFQYGLLTWNSGNNATYTMEVRSITSGEFQLALPMPFDISEGDGYSVYAGCDKTGDTCRDKFANLVNFRGFPFIPGILEAFSYGESSND